MPPSCCNIASFKVMADWDERMRKAKLSGWELVFNGPEVKKSSEAL